MPHRCALGCKNTDSSVVMHMFPNPKRFPEHFRAWVNLLSGKFETLSDHEIYMRKRICDIHFTDGHRNRFKRLNALAMPTLYLPGDIGSITKEAISGSDPAIPVIPQVHDTNTGETNHILSSTAAVLSEHNYSALSRTSRNMLSKAVLLNYECVQMKQSFNIYHRWPREIIKCEYFQLVYNADKSYQELRLLNKLTEAHVIPEKNLIQVEQIVKTSKKSKIHIFFFFKKRTQNRFEKNIVSFLDMLSDSPFKCVEHKNNFKTYFI